MPHVMTDMTDLLCIHCGIAFAVPSEWVTHRQLDERDFFCPNGHTQSFIKPDAPEPPTRGELIQALHRAEQAEAKAAELAEQQPAEQPKRRQRSKAE